MKHVCVCKIDGRKCMRGKWNRLSLRTLSSLCHHHNHFILVMFVRSTDFYRCWFNCSKTLLFCLPTKKFTHWWEKIHNFACFCLSFSSFFFSFHVRIFFFSCSVVSFDDVMLRFASIFCLCISYRWVFHAIFNKRLFLTCYWLNVISRNAQHILDFFIAHVLVC